MRYTEKAGDIKELCCPPYDIIGDEGRAELLQRNPRNIVRLELPKTTADAVGEDDAYVIAAQFLRDWRGRGYLKNDEKPGIYIYEMSFDVYGARRSVKGFVSLVRLEEFAAGVILPHEETLSKPKADRLDLMKATGCNFSQVYSLYTDEDGGVCSALEKASAGAADCEFTDHDMVTHRMWCVCDEEIIASLCAKMQDKKLYIADGHHRYETALAYRDAGNAEGIARGTADYIPMMLVNMESAGLVVFPTHRVVRGLEGFNYDEVTEKCAQYFDITKHLNREKGEQALESAYKDGKKAFVLFSGDNNYTAMVLRDPQVMEELMPGGSVALRELDVSVLHTLVLERIFGIDKENMANQTNLLYTRSADEAISAVDGKRANCCFLLNPTRVEEIRDVALAGEKMPQKSTYFYPKLTTGLVMNQIL